MRLTRFQLESLICLKEPLRLTEVRQSRCRTRVKEEFELTMAVVIGSREFVCFGACARARMFFPAVF